ncbi:MAG: translation initiation factor IF-2 subunit beta [Nanoarchaeota archaeon]|nr:translation initiation factor IF-2 subunit beta [Nanoarchaeota archaeon]
MEEKEYMELLDKAYEDLPEVLYKKARFEIPEVRGKIIKTRTVITNFRTIAKHLERKEEHFQKFMLKDVGVRGDLSPKGELILHSRFQPAVLNKAVKNYFTNYVECSHCNSPDTVLNADATQLKCNACGHQEKKAKV